MKEFTYTIKEPVGIHARPAGMLAKEAKACQSTVTIVDKNGKSVDATRLMALMGTHRNGGHDFFKNAHDDTVSFSFGNVVACGNAVNEVETIHLNTPGGSARPRQLKGMWLRGRRIFLGVALKNQGSA